MSEFKKAERLCSKKEIDILFSEGQSFIVYPFRITYSLKKKDKFPCRVLIVVPKKRINKAVERNLIKRRIREAYRASKNEFYYSLERKNIQLNLMILYVSNEMTDYKSVKSTIDKAIGKLKELLVMTKK